MSFLKNLATITKMGNEIQRTTDVGAQLAQASQAMQQATATMAAMTDRASLAATGTPAQATVLDARATGTYVNFEPVVQLDLMVMAPSRVPFPVTISEVVPQLHLARLHPGASIGVRVGATADALCIDWTVG